LLRHGVRSAISLKGRPGRRACRRGTTACSSAADGVPRPVAGGGGPTPSEAGRMRAWRSTVAAGDRCRRRWCGGGSRCSTRAARAAVGQRRSTAVGFTTCRLCASRRRVRHAGNRVLCTQSRSLIALTSHGTADVAHLRVHSPPRARGRGRRRPATSEIALRPTSPRRTHHTPCRVGPRRCRRCTCDCVYFDVTAVVDQRAAARATHSHSGLDAAAIFPGSEP